MTRFFVDVIVLLVYAIMFARFDSILFVGTASLIVLAMYTVWDVFAYLERRSYNYRSWSTSDFGKAISISAITTILVSIFWALRFFVIPVGSYDPWNDYSLIAILFVIIAGYRISKYYCTSWATPGEHAASNRISKACSYCDHSYTD